MNNQREGYANPEDRIEQLADKFVRLRIGERYGITFERFVELEQNGTWSTYLID
jgi:hypothetical protein